MDNVKKPVHIWTEADFEPPEVPNAETLAAMNEPAEERRQAATVDEMMAFLNDE